MLLPSLLLQRRGSRQLSGGRWGDASTHLLYDLVYGWIRVLEIGRQELQESSEHTAASTTDPQRPRTLCCPSMDMAMPRHCGGCRPKRHLCAIGLWPARDSSEREALQLLRKDDMSG